MSSAYNRARLYHTQSVLTTSPGQLVLMLYDGIIRFLDQAQEAGLRTEDPRRIEIMNTAITKAQNILTELRSNLNFEAGGDYARDLDRLYDYYLRRLFQANLSKDNAPLAEVSRLVAQLREGWAEMLKQEAGRAYDSTRGVAVA